MTTRPPPRPKVHVSSFSGLCVSIRNSVCACVHNWMCFTALMCLFEYFLVRWFVCATIRMYACLRVIVKVFVC